MRTNACGDSPGFEAARRWPARLRRAALVAMVQAAPGPALEAFELDVAGELARHGEASPEAFSFMRRALGVKAMDLAEMLDVTPETVSRWEHGQQPIDRGAAAILSAMVVDRLEGRTTALDSLKALQRPEPLPRVVRLFRKSA
jgi:DNA-binding transcriptional regulator YiaG